jgi:hypothetical protein
VDTANGTDYYECWVNSNAAVSITGNSAVTFFQGFAISPQGPAGPQGTPGPTTPADAFIATLSADQTGVAATTWTKVNFNTVGYNQNSKFNTSTSRWTPSAGPVQIEAQLSFSANATIYAGIYKNGAIFKQMVIVGANESRITVTDNANGTDYYEAWIWAGVAGSVQHDASITFFQGFAISPQGPAGTAGPISPTDPYLWTECGRLTFVSATQLKFAPFKGDRIKINGTVYAIPAAGIAGLNNTGIYLNGVAGQNLGVNILYYVYCFNNAGVLTADFSTTGHATSTTAGNVGTEIKNGDDTRSLIGLIYTTSASQFNDILNTRYVRSWFNRPPVVFGGGGTLSGGTSTVWASTGVATGFFVVFADDIVDISVIGFGTNTIASTNYIGLGLDSTTVASGAYQGAYQSLANTYIPLAAHYVANLAEGFHSAYALYQVGGGSLTFYPSLYGAIHQ